MSLPSAPKPWVAGAANRESLRQLPGSEHRGTPIELKPSRSLGQTLAQLLARDLRLRRFARCLLSTGLLEDLDEAGPYSVFAPADSAFARLPPGAFELWFEPEHVNALFDFSEFHVVRGLVADTAVPEHLFTLEGRPLVQRAYHTSLRINGQAKVLDSWLARNGVVHWVDALLLPPRSELPGLGVGAPAQLNASRPGSTRSEPTERPSRVRLSAAYGNEAALEPEAPFKARARGAPFAQRMLGQANGQSPVAEATAENLGVDDGIE